MSVNIQRLSLTLHTNAADEANKQYPVSLLFDLTSVRLRSITIGYQYKDVMLDSRINTHLWKMSISYFNTQGEKDISEKPVYNKLIRNIFQTTRIMYLLKLCINHRTHCTIYNL